MHKFGKIVAAMGMLSLLSVMPLAAQVDYNVVFKHPSLFTQAMSSCLQALTKLPNRSQVPG